MEVGPGDGFEEGYRRYLAAVVLFHVAAADRVGLGATEYQACQVLELDGPMTHGDLSRRLALTTGATTRLVDRLVAAGLVRRVTDPDDRRRSRVEHLGVMPAGLAEVLAAVRGPVGGALAGLDDHQLGGVRHYLARAGEAYADAARRLGDPSS